jgi:hypothetical protein
MSRRERLEGHDVSGRGDQIGWILNSQEWRTVSVSRDNIVNPKFIRS